MRRWMLMRSWVILERKIKRALQKGVARRSREKKNESIGAWGKSWLTRPCVFSIRWLFFRVNRQSIASFNSFRFGGGGNSLRRLPLSFFHFFEGRTLHDVHPLLLFFFFFFSPQASSRSGERDSVPYSDVPFPPSPFFFYFFSKERPFTMVPTQREESFLFLFLFETCTLALL